MIVVFDWRTAQDYTTLGNAVLCPTKCDTHQVGGGAYTLTMVHPIDQDGKWEYLQEDNVIRCPVQEETIENAYSGAEMWVYTTAAATALRQTPNDPQPITYTQWTPDLGVGDKATYNGNNYQCIYFDQASSVRYTTPDISPWWKRIANSTSGGTVVASLPAGTKLIWISGAYADTWWQMSTFGGVTGWIKQEDLTGEEHRTQEDIQPITIRDQLFRIRRVTVNNQTMMVMVDAEHVSYDANGSLVQAAQIALATPAMALQLMQEGLYTPYTAGMISTNLTTDDAGTFTQTIKNKSLMACLLDPSNGIVATFDAAYKRNNWDLYILKKTDVNRGFAIRYGINARGIEWTKDRTDVITQIIPIAKSADGGDLYLPEIFVESPLAANYPVQRMRTLTVDGQVGKDDGTGTDTVWTEEALLDEMRAKAQEQFTVNHVDVRQMEATVDFTLLGDTEEYPELKRLERAIMYDIVTVYDPRIKMDVQLRVTEIYWDAIKERITGLKVSNIPGRNAQSISGYMLVNGSVTSASLSGQTLTDIINAAADQAVAILS